MAANRITPKIVRKQGNAVPNGECRSTEGAIYIVLTR